MAKKPSIFADYRMCVPSLRRSVCPVRVDPNPIPTLIFTVRTPVDTLNFWPTPHVGRNPVY